MLTKEDKREIIEELKKEIQKVNVNIEIVRDIDLPTYAHINDAGMDVRSAIDIEIHPNETVLIPLGFKLNIPDNYEIQIRARSGISFKTPLRISNGIGTIDSGYKGELAVIMTNTSIVDNGAFTLDSKDNCQGTYIIHKGDRIAQIVLCKYSTIEFNKVDKINQDDDRNGGFGSSGTN